MHEVISFITVKSAALNHVLKLLETFLETQVKHKELVQEVILLAISS